jgi:cysteine desulfurase/selenocysteine lyase
MRKSDFPIFRELIHKKPLIYLDNAATTQKPQIMIDALNHYFSHDNANVHRGVYALSSRATESFEQAREIVRHFIQAADSREIIFTKGTTESINLVAESFGRCMIKAQDEIVISAMEHHANIVPWQMLCKATGATLKILPVLDDGSLDLAVFQQLLTPKTKLVALTQVSHVLGTINPVKEIIQMAHAREIPVLIDGAQAVAHMPVNVQALDCDFYVFSGHKLYGPTGIGILYGKQKWLEKMPPYQTGGHMIKKVSFMHTEFGEIPHKFEAGTPPIAEAIALGVAIEYVQQIGFPAIIQHERKLTEYLSASLQKFPQLFQLGSAEQKIGLVSFALQHVHAHDVATILDSEGVAVRAGHHCAMPLMERFNVPATVRISLGLYNEENDIDRLMQALSKATKLLG